MAAKADGTIYVNTEIETDGFKTGGREVEAAARRMAKTVSGIGETAKLALQKQTDAFIKQNQKYAQQQQRVKELKKQYQEMSKQKIPTQEYGALDKELNKLGADYEKIAARQQRFLETGGKKGSSTYKRMEYDLDQLDKKQDVVIAKMKQLESSGKAYKSVDTSAIEQKLGAEHEKLVQMRNAVNTTYESLKLKAEQYGGTLAQSVQDTSDTIKSHGDLVKQYAGALESSLNGLRMAAHAPVSAIKLLGKSAKNISSKSASLLADSIKKLGNIAKNTAKSMLRLHNNTKKSNGSLGVGLKNILKYTLGIRGLRVLFNKAIDAMKDGFNNLAKYSSQTNADLSSLVSALAQLKNSLATAFAPILTVVTPVLTQFINLLSQAATYVAQLMAALTGKDSYTKAISVQKDYAESLEGTADAADKAAGSLSAYDKLNTIQENNSASSGAGVSEQEFEEQEIDSPFLNLADRIKEAWKQADFTDIGLSIGDKLKNAFDSIPWNEIKAKAYNLGKSLATLLNGVFKTEGLGETIGKTIGEALNTGLYFAYGFIHNFDFGTFGRFVGDSINGAFLSFEWSLLGQTLAELLNGIFQFILDFAQTVQWKEIGSAIVGGINTFISGIDPAVAAQGISELIKGILDFCITLLEGTDWKLLGEKTAEFIANIDWAGIFDGVFEAIGAALGGLASFLWGLIEEAWNSVIEWWNEAAFEDGQFTIQGLFDGILEALKNVGEWINEHIFEPFIEGFKTAFGIHSPSTVMFEMGTYVMQGLFNGINSLVGSVVGIFSTLKTSITTKLTELKENVAKKAREIKSDALSKFSDLKESAVSIFSKMKGSVLEIWDGIVSGIRGAVSKIKNAANKVKDTVFGTKETTISYSGSRYLSGSATPNFSTSRIPRLATGAVIPPNSEFLAVLGDQKHGTNIETPLDTMIDAFKQAMKEMGGTGTGKLELTLMLDSSVILKKLLDLNEQNKKKSGKPLFS